jgi:hypothetical protein
MSAIIQVTSLDGKIISSARWEIQSIVNLREGHNFQISILTKDTKILGYIGKLNNTDLSVDHNKDIYSVILNCVVKQIRHLLETSTKQLESLAVVMPASRMVESVIVYMMSQDKCDPRFVKLVQGG